MENQAKVDYLKSLNLEVTEVHDDEGVSFEAPDCYDAYILFEDFDIGDTQDQICYHAEYYSCCGDRLDKDWMVCPSCLEHC